MELIEAGVDGGWERVVTIVLGGTLVLALAGVVYVSMLPAAESESYTELYILGPDGTAGGYPTNISVDETGTIIVGISNNEQKAKQYTVVLQFENQTIDQQTLTVAVGATWEQDFSFTPRSPGKKTLRILLFEGESPGSSAEPYRQLRLVVNVHEQ